MKKTIMLTATAVMLSAPAVVRAEQIQADLTGYEEVPIVSTAAAGNFRAKISNDGQFIDYTLSYEGLQGTILQAHIHAAQPGVNGGIVVWLCGTASNPGPAGTPLCAPGSGEVTGTITAPNVVAAPPAQQIAAGELSEVIDAIRAGTAYVNVHSNLSPGGEIRGQIKGSRRP